tara:strand:+ start:1480 stop:1887 length:408 start_codon:yes stop_codon:yes gene_type:complete
MTFIINRKEKVMDDKIKSKIEAYTDSIMDFDQDTKHRDVYSMFEDIYKLGFFNGQREEHEWPSTEKELFPEKFEFEEGEYGNIQKETFLFLDELKDSGVVNMFGATDNIMNEFGYTREQSKKLLVEWMGSHPSRK